MWFNVSLLSDTGEHALKGLKNRVLFCCTFYKLFIRILPERVGMKINKINYPVSALAIILICVFLAGCGQGRKDQLPIAGLEEKCLRAGGAVYIVDCTCWATQDFPNICIIGGGCTCAPTDKTHQIKMCDCGEGKCFNGSTCVSLQKSGGVIGGDKDKNGCTGSAGYIWCESRQKCLRPWE
jgi:hypothetical protein